ncbi:putative glycoside hydrolase [Nocardia sp. NPDC051570]|uniref:putative glycoside hydrolase n=1 Tax=Nocardia sp. NPDC051570 TaxID=3364324 RepID=UPI0037A7388C
MRSLNRRQMALIAVGAVAVLLLGSMVLGAGRGQPTGLPLRGLPGEHVGAAALPTLELRVDARGHDPHAVRLKLDGTEVTGRIDGDAVLYHPEHLADGTHTFAAEIPPGGPFGFLRTGPGAFATFTVRTTPPELELAAAQSAPTSFRQPMTVRGTAIGAERVRIGEQSVTPGPDGHFEISLPHALVGAEVVAVDVAGNQTVRKIENGIDLGHMKAVHVTAHAWTYDPMREGVLDLARQGRINTVQLDIKDEDGIVGYDSQVPLARESGAVEKLYDAPAVLRQLHDLGLRVVGRIVAFRDPIVADWAWHTGHQDWVIQDPSGNPYSSRYGPIAFTNFAHPAIRDYNIALAVEAARLGFDGIMYDYVRRPDGPLSAMAFPGLTDNPNASIADFLRQSRDPVHDAGAHLSAAVFGIAVNRPDEIAQDITLMSRYVDYIAPMVYPSHWNPGEYNVPNPNSEPYDIVLRSLQDFRARTAGSTAIILPWLQDFSLGVAYGDAEVRAQIDATRASGIDGFFLWSPEVSYHEGALGPN